MIVTFMALIWTGLMWVSPQTFDVPMPALSAAALALFFAKTMKTLLLYPPKVRSGLQGRADGVGRGPVAHAYGRQGGDLGTCSPRASRSCARPNAKTRRCFRRCCAWSGRKRRCSVSACWRLLSLASGGNIDDPAIQLWMVMIGVQSLPYLATIVTAAISAMSYKSLSVQCRASKPAPQPEPALPKAA